MPINLMTPPSPYGAHVRYNARAILGDYRALGEALWPRFNTGRDEILWYYRGLADIFLALGERGPARLAGELGRTVTEIERLADASATPPLRKATPR